MKRTLGALLGHDLAVLFGADAGRQIREDLENFARAWERGGLAVG
jgi:hypothetical protein